MVDAAPPEERAEVLKVPDLAGAGFSPDSPFDGRLRDALLATIYRSGANLVLLPIQDIFAGAIASTCPARLVSRTGRGGCRSRSATC